jgi:coproporphyrinogen III oxidase-like Fe-S oxidoreductase
MGFGLGAMTELPGIVAQNTTVFDDWMSRLMVGQAPDRTGVELSNDAASERDVFMRLGASLRVRIDEPEAADSRIFSALASDGLLETDGDTLKVTTTGRYVLNQYWQDSSLYQRWFKGCA